jgi:phosphonoacetaldehyde hydrolase
VERVTDAIGLVVFDWAGTLLDFGCRAPLVAFHEAFREAGVPITDADARKPMGAHKRDHVREILRDPGITARVRAERGREPDEALVAEIYGAFGRRLPSLLPAHADPIPGSVEVLHWLRERGVRVGSTTGYTRAMMDVLEPVARRAGITPEVVLCADEVPMGRPAPWACFRIAEQMGVYPMQRAVKVGDTPADMAEGRNAGMLCVGVTESGNEVGLSQGALEALPAPERARLVAEAEARLQAAGAHAVLRSVAELPAWLAARVP